MTKSNSGPSRPVAHNATSSRRTKTSGRGRAGSESFRSRHPVITALIPVGLVLAVIVTMVVIKAASGPATAASSHLQSGRVTRSTQSDTSSLSPAVVASLAVPTSVLDAVGSPNTVALPSAVTGNTSILKDASGKALITYVGAEYCPYCAAERWALAVALSRFGTFTHLGGTHSSSSDVFPDTQTLSFYGSTYSSPYVDFASVEEATNEAVNGSYPSLQTPTASEGALLSEYDSQGSIPFLDIANKFVVTGASYSPQVLQGLTRKQIARDLSDPSSAVAQAIDGTANDITAAICIATGDQPTSVCATPTISAIVKKLEG